MQTIPSSPSSRTVVGDPLHRSGDPARSPGPLFVALFLVGLLTSACSGAVDPLVDEAVESPTAERSDVAELSEALRSAGASTMAGLVEERGLNWTDGDAITLLAPSDEAFASLDADALASLLANEVQLSRLLSIQTMNGHSRLDELVSAGSVMLSDGSVVPVVAASPGFTIGDAVVVESDLEAGSAIVHVVDRFLTEVADERIAG